MLDLLGQDQEPAVFVAQSGAAAQRGLGQCAVPTQECSHFALVEHLPGDLFEQVGGALPVLRIQRVAHCVDRIAVFGIPLAGLPVQRSDLLSVLRP
jgi:hypothetical protein